jgi:hypothetical protein
MDTGQFSRSIWDMGFTPNGNKEIPSGTNTNILI